MFRIPTNLIFSHDIITQANVRYRQYTAVSGIPRFDVTKAAVAITILLLNA
jgi:hypothetical protein